MSTSAAPLPGVRAALTGLIDYAGLFPPAQLGMAEAVREYAQARRGNFAWMLGRFIVPRSRVAELRSAVPQGEAQFALSVILDADWDARELMDLHEREASVQLQTLEIPLAHDEVVETASALSRAGLSHFPAFVEWPRDADWLAELPAIVESVAANGLSAKIRCGGVVARAFPTPEEIGAFVYTAALRRVRFKATAGLHHPVRHLNAQTGFHMHGFFNLLFASVFALGGAGEETIVRCIADERPQNFQFLPDGLSWEGRTASLRQIEAARRDAFAGYGSCSFDEPVEDLQSLGLI